MFKVVGTQIKYEMNVLAITSGSLIMMPFSLMEVLEDVSFVPRILCIYECLTALIYFIITLNTIG